MNKKKIILAILAVLFIFVAAERLNTKKAVVQKEEAKKAITVSTQSVAESKMLQKKNQYPGSVIVDQEVQITAKASGTVTVAPGNIGSSIKTGSLLAKIDDIGMIETGEEGFKSLQIQQSQLAVEQAKKSYDLAKDNYDDLKKSDEASDSEVNSAKTQRDIAKLQYENATLGLTGTVDNHSITSPIDGIIIKKAVSVGDSISIGQPIATISKSSNIKIQFFVDALQRNNFSRGQKISAIDGEGKSTTLIVKNIAIAADQSTKRFLIEAYPEKQTETSLLSGTIATILTETKVKPQDEKNILLPLSAISVGQNENYIFIVENKTAKKIPATIVKVDGETAEISCQLEPEAMIIIEGNKLVRDCETVTVQN